MNSGDKNERPVADTKLSLHPTEEHIKSDLWKEMIEDELEELPPIKEGDVNISSSYLYDQGDKLEVSIYIRNGLKTTINFEKLPLLLINSKGEVLAEEVFDLSPVGDIPALSVRPWKIYFHKENLKVDSFPMDDWKVVFNNSVKAVNYISTELEDLPKEFDQNTIFALQSYVNSLPKLEKGQVSIDTFFVKENPDGSLGVTLILRNALDKDVQLDKLPITVYDAKGNLAAKGVFENANIAMKARKATVREFVFLKEQRIPGEFDFQKWTVKFE